MTPLKVRLDLTKRQDPPELSLSQGPDNPQFLLRLQPRRRECYPEALIKRARVGLSISGMQPGPTSPAMFRPTSGWPKPSQLSSLQRVIRGLNVEEAWSGL
ncbi:hypothetical protein PGT21_018332 [Puccinia graminis f. sp. tritici]|uniref:Uncharacterized protein n=1 Tax=Puccinia graminis f. sp. tritici TaxID=56615 RepID=A0A5B0Q5U2_PUCGR|nr:hypothetical protein PGT21_018332 [Puccinia graminis f. sp. tritici]